MKSSSTRSLYHALTLALVAMATLAACVEDPFMDDVIGEESFEITHGDRDYAFVTTPKTWDQAATICDDHGYYLVTVSGWDEESWLGTEQARHGGGPWWIGFHDTWKEGWWLWAGGSTPVFTNWNDGEPNNFFWAEHCAVDNWDNTGRWNDVACDGLYNFICERSTLPRVSGVFTYAASWTEGAQHNTHDYPIFLQEGALLTVGTCGVTGASYSGDTVLRINNPGGQEIARNDDACDGFGSNLSIVAPVSGTYVVRAGCFSSTSCSGTVAYRL